MTRQELIANIRRKKSFLCVGLDTDLQKVPEHLLKEDDPIFAFNKAIIDATAPYCVAYKPNLAFYEAFGVKGLMAFEKTVKYLHCRTCGPAAPAPRAGSPCLPSKVRKRTTRSLQKISNHR